MAMQRKRIILTGAYFGRSMAIGDWWFQDGVLEYELDSVQWVPFLNKVRFWAAFEIGTDEYFDGLKVTHRILTDDGRPKALEIAGRIKTELEKHGHGIVSKADEPREPEGVLGHLLRDEPGDNAFSGVSDLLGTNATPARKAGSSSVPDGGQAVSAASIEEKTIPAQSTALKEALAMIDPTDNDRWTREGAPKIAAVEDFYDANDLTRKLIEEVWPGFNREQARTIWGTPNEQATG